MAAHPRRSSYSIFVRFRRSRLSLRRGIARVEDALAIAEELRADRFHDQGDIFVVKVPEGTLIELPPLATGAQDGGAPFAASLPPPLVPPAALPAAPVTEGAPADAPSPLPTEPADPTESELPAQPRARVGAGHLDAASPAAAPPRRLETWGELASILKMIEQVARFRRAMERAHAVRARLDLACSEAERALLSHHGSPPAALSRACERLAALRESSARSVDSFERAGAVVAHRLDVARAHVGGAP